MGIGLPLAFVILASAGAFNVDTVHPIVYSDPFPKEDSYFGYSVQILAAGPAGNKWILVGAPRANSNYSEHVNITEPGKLYRCGFSDESMESCEPVIVDPTGNGRNDTVPGRRYIDRKDYGWLGGSIAATDSSTGKVAVCSHRWANKIFRYGTFTNGACYVSSRDVPAADSFTKILPLVNGSMQYESSGSTPDDVKYVFAFGQAGFSSHMLKNSQNTEEIILGAPVVSWTGTVIRLRDSSSNIGDFTDILIPLPSNNPELKRNDYFGYSVYSGHFLDNNKTFYVSGAPRAAEMKGSVFLFEFGLGKVIIHATLNGSQVGEYFGSSVLVLDVNSDGLDDLLVGAPQYTVNLNSPTVSGDEGKVDVFINEGNWVFVKVKNSLLGQKARGARFGSSIINAGRLTNDNYNDVIIGAPYEEGKGAVYIYQTGPSGVTPKYVQRIAASDFPFPLRGFGISVSAGDIDGNSFPDLAIGSYQSNQAVLLRSYPVVNIRTSLVSDPPKMSPDDGVSILTACANYTVRSEEPGDICVSVTILLDVGFSSSRLVLEADGTNVTKSHTYIEEVTRNKNRCRNFPLYLMGGILNLSRQVIVRMRTTLLTPDCKPQPNITAGSEAIFVPETQQRQRGTVDFCPDCPVVDRREPNIAEVKIPFVTGCKNDAVCESDLNVDAAFIGLEDDFIIGVVKTATLRTIVTSYKDPAYLARLDLTLPDGVNLQRIPDKCRREAAAGEAAVYSCSLGNPLNTLTTVTVEFELDLSDVKSGTESLTFKLVANTTSAIVSESGHRNILEVVLPAKTVADIVINGVADNEQQYYWKKNETSPGTREIPFGHTYEIINRKSPLNLVRLEFSIPDGVSTPDGSFSVIEVLEIKGNHRDQPITCDGTDQANDQDVNTRGAPSRIKRNPQTSTLESKVGLSTPANRTSFFNCSLPGVKCTLISCALGNLEMNSRATVSIKGTFFISNIAHHLGEKDIVVLYSAAAAVVVSPPAATVIVKTEVKDAYSSFIPLGGPAPELVQAWILAVAVIAGLLLFILLVALLIKCGFFNRKRVEDMEQLEAEGQTGAESPTGEEEPEEEPSERHALNWNE